MDEKWMKLASERRAERLATLRRIGAPAAIIAAEESRPLEELARVLWAYEESERPEVLAAFGAAHPNHEPHPEDEGMWVLSRARNQDEVDAWDAARAADLEYLRGVKAPHGEVVTAPSGARWLKQDTRFDIDAGFMADAGSDWKQVSGPGRPVRDFEPVSVWEWVLAGLDD